MYVGFTRTIHEVRDEDILTLLFKIKYIDWTNIMQYFLLTGKQSEKLLFTGVWLNSKSQVKVTSFVWFSESAEVTS